MPGTRKSSTIHGSSSDGASYENVDVMWAQELSQKTENNELEWYTKALDYWKSSEASVNGVLGGFEDVSPGDLKETLEFMREAQREIAPFGSARCIDCGCGIGRVTAAVLVHLFDKIDLMEPCSNLMDKAKTDVPAGKIGEVRLESLQNFHPEPKSYDCIFIQWATLYLTDDDLIACWKRCQAGLKENGIIFLKENVTSSGNFHIDKVDSSITRADAQYRQSFKAAGLQLLAVKDQVQWPADLFPVKR
jgi:protein N-terminal methyltransferase